LCTESALGMMWALLGVLLKPNRKSQQVQPQGPISRSNLRRKFSIKSFSLPSSSSRRHSLGEGITRIKRKSILYSGSNYWAHNFRQLN